MTNISDMIPWIIGGLAVLYAAAWLASSAYFKVKDRYQRRLVADLNKED